MIPLRHVVLAAALSAATSGPALGHAEDRVFSRWHVAGTEISARITIPIRLATAFAGRGELLHQIAGGVHVGAASATCAARPPMAGWTADGSAAVVELYWRCDRAPPYLDLGITALFGRFPGHLHFARIDSAGGGPTEHVFTVDRSRQHIVLGGPDKTRATLQTVLAGYLVLGIRHILLGADHLAFILGLMLIAVRPRRMAVAVTGFTLGHSVTLALAATGAVGPHGAAVEALIGFTVVVAAAEAIRRHSGGPRHPRAMTATVLALAGLAAVLGSALPARAWAGLVLFTACYTALARTADRESWLPVLASAFGLVHGLGFAGALQEIGLPQGRLVTALLGFNLGVEFGQAMAVAGLWTVSALAARWWPGLRAPWMPRALAAALCGLGVFWFLTRAFA